MANGFTTTGGTSHSTLLTGLTNGQTYTLYVKCQDAAGNANMNDFIISFSAANIQNPGDLNGDKVVNILDILLIVKDFGKTTGFNPVVDLNNDGAINILDILGVVKYFGVVY